MKQGFKETLYIIGFLIIFLTLFIDISGQFRGSIIVTLFVLVCILRFIVPTKNSKNRWRKYTFPLSITLNYVNQNKVLGQKSNVRNKISSSQPGKAD